MRILPSFVALGMLASATAPAPAQDASFGCKVLLCAAATNPGWPSIPYCVPVMQQLFSMMAKGGGIPACAQAGSSGGNVGYQPFNSCPAGSVSVSQSSASSAYQADPSGSQCATPADLAAHQVDPSNAPPPLTARPTNPNPYYVDVGSGTSTSRITFNLMGK
ncbi:hypothetical protein SAMN05519103_08500 [Rhizobiales bacterium GAS113]|nr:hypothetical protein SAMN05519103_08500 [Rhizobiales bacterium GAS113]